MAREVVWTDSAWEDLEAAAEYIARDSEAYAASFVEEMVEEVLVVRRDASQDESSQAKTAAARVPERQRGRGVGEGEGHSLADRDQSNVRTVRATSPAFMARNASLMSSSRPRRVTISSSKSRP
jgi:plasmid stabilization system protein ParE